ncbi:hypothetical protein CGRA01v4_09518 [Colletotrichum graminicola]|nr:hypothetical protein CGRA01v4_09518 [Colletotrichum graminicola]
MRIKWRTDSAPWSASRLVCEGLRTFLDRQERQALNAGNGYVLPVNCRLFPQRPCSALNHGSKTIRLDQKLAGNFRATCLLLPLCFYLFTLCHLKPVSIIPPLNFSLPQ